MSTHCFIAFEHEDGQFSVRYCGFDGYPQHTGKVLLNYYNRVQMEALMECGMDLESINEEGKPEFYEKEDLMRPERMSPDEFRLFVSKGSSFARYVYVVLKTGKWQVCDAGEHHLGFRPIADAILVN